MPEDPIIHLDYDALREDEAEQAAIAPEMVKKAQGLFGRKARQGILQAMDSTLRVLAAQIAQRKVNPQKLHEVGRAAILEAVDLYRIGQTDSFRKFANVKARQAMVAARDRLVNQPGGTGLE
jgi:ABC-type transporter MlaC component